MGIININGPINAGKSAISKMLKGALQRVLFYLNVKILRAQPDDAYIIKKIHVETYKKSYRGFVPDQYLDHMPFDDEIIERTKKYLENTECWLAFYQNEPAGFAY